MIDEFHRFAGVADIHDGASQARLAAEAAFSRQPLPPETASTTVVIKRRRAISPVDARESDEGRQDTEPAQPRRPKVFRLEAHDPPAGENQGVAEGSEAITSASSIESNGSPHRTPLKRRRRRVLAGKVTIVRPMESQASLESPVIFEPTEDVAPQRQRRGNGDVRAGEFVSERLQNLYRELKALEQLAQEARAREAAVAIKWIKQAIQTYDLNASDLAI